MGILDFGFWIIFGDVNIKRCVVAVRIVWYSVSAYDLLISLEEDIKAKSSLTHKIGKLSDLNIESRL